MVKKIYIVETISQHRMIYAISSKEDLRNKYRNGADREIEEKIVKYAPAELTQKWDGEYVVRVDGPFTNEEYIKKHDELFKGIEMNDNDKLIVIDYEKLNEENIELDDSEKL